MALFLARVGMAVFGLLLVVPASYATKIQRVVSPGGIEAWLVEDYAVPVIAVNFAFKGGAAQDPAGKPGVANMLSGLLDEGAGDLDSKAFQAILDDQSIGISFDAGRDDFYGNLKTLSENRDEAFHLLALAIQSPRLDPEPIERIRAQIATNLKQMANDPETVAMQTLCAATFPGHPYSQPTNGTVASVALVSRDDLNAYRKRIFARDHLKIAIVGAINAADTGAMLDQVFGSLPAKADLVAIPDVAPTPSVSRIDEPNPQTIIRFGGPGIRRNDPDFMTAFVVNHILGGGTFSSRLYSEVREKRGLAYSISTSLLPLDYSSVLAGGTATRADRAEATIDLIQNVIAKFAADGPSEEELAKAKSYLIGSYALRFDSSSKIARQLLGIQIDGRGIDYVEKRNDLVAAVTLTDAKRVAKRLLSTATSSIVMVGPKKTETAPKS